MLQILQLVHQSTWWGRGHDVHVEVEPGAAQRGVSGSQEVEKRGVLYSICTPYLVIVTPSYVMNLLLSVNLLYDWLLITEVGVILLYVSDGRNQVITL